MNLFRYVFIGAGVIGNALCKALVSYGALPAEQVALVDTNPVMLKKAEALGCAVFTSLEPVVNRAETIVLAVKPQDSATLLTELAKQVAAKPLMVSVMAGISTQTLKQALPSCAVVRVMPNTPVQIGQGMNVYYASADVTDTQLHSIEKMLHAAGASLRVNEESMIDAATAISGCGPAYLFFMAEHWTQAAIDLGFDETAAALLVQQTILGAVQLWQHDQVSPQQLRQQVTSKGGATAAALEYWQSKPVASLLKEGIQQAHTRSCELGNE